jgi:MinD superfamily P-loop ATPase
MKQIAIISGKGGTGKTILTASFAVLAEHKVMADCDVDAADLHLLLKPDAREKHDFKGLPKAYIDQKSCNECMECRAVCRFDAVVVDDKKTVIIDRTSCEGCGICRHLCPPGAIIMQDNVAGAWYVSATRYGVLVHAALGIAEENSGKLVSQVRAEAKKIAEQQGADYIIIDGPPGIGCPALATLTGVDYAVIVTEPTLSGIHDMERAVAVARHFNIATGCVVNKYDINPEHTRRIEAWCGMTGVTLLGRIPFDLSVTKALMERVPVIEYTKNTVTEKITDIWNRVS